ncbi:outer membrane protein assembly factor BamB family protein [Thermobifida halotolerans]|uniref:outer membrane protein assembly factor BamB family protein n=1 Tax=Thermobifida halotolerans TaxID=483545 RepID=UPI0009FBD003|nr:PQQ-binding-like beta-propeller repeat protein [Thermobifida halotolerans]
MGILATGLLATLVAPLFGHDGSGHDPRPVIRVFFWALAGLCGWLMLLQLLERVPEEEQQQAARPPVALGAVLAVAAAGMAWLETPVWLLGLAEPERGSTPWPVLGWVGQVAVAVGATVVAAVGHSHRPRWTGPLPGLASGAAVTLLLAAAGWMGATEVLVRHTTVDAAAAEPVPSVVREVAWTWHPPEGREARRVLATSAGAVVDVGDGVVALDTATGEETWYYRRPGRRVEVNVTPDGRTVVLAFTVHHRDVRGGLLTLDAATGQVRGDALAPSDLPFRRSGIPSEKGLPDIDLLTSDARILLEEGRGQLVARSLETDEVLWTAALDPGCLVDIQPHGWIRTFSDMVVVSQNCHEDLAEFGAGARWKQAALDLRGGTNRLTAFDAATGAPEWLVERPKQGPLGANPEITYHRDGSRSYLHPVTSDGSVVAVEKWGSGSRYLVVDRMTGEVLADDLDLTENGKSIHFTADSVSVVRIDEELGGTLVHERRTLDGELAASAASNALFPHVFAGIEWVDLADAAVVVHLGEDTGTTDAYDIGVAPWDGSAEPFSVPFDAGRPDAEISRVRLVPAPGALVVFLDDPDRPISGLR